MELSRPPLGPPPTAPTGPSFAAALVVTAAMLAVALVAGSGAPRGWWDRSITRPVAERITYVAPVVPETRPVATPLTAARGASRGAPATSAAGAPTTGGTAVTAPTVSAPQVAPFPAPGQAADTGRGVRPAPGAAASAGAAAATRGPTISPMPLRVGAELPASKPLSGEQKDSALRALKFRIFTPEAVAAAVAAAHDAKARREDEQRREIARTAHGGAPYYHGLAVGISVPLPGGGPSAAQRKRDAAIDSEVRVRLANAAARGRQRSDSVLASTRDSARLVSDTARATRIPRRDSL